MTDIITVLQSTLSTTSKSIVTARNQAAASGKGVSSTRVVPQALGDAIDKALRDGLCATAADPSFHTLRSVCGIGRRDEQVTIGQLRFKLGDDTTTLRTAWDKMVTALRAMMSGATWVSVDHNQEPHDVTVYSDDMVLVQCLTTTSEPADDSDASYVEGSAGKDDVVDVEMELSGADAEA